MSLVKTYKEIYIRNFADVARWKLSLQSSKVKPSHEWRMGFTTCYKLAFFIIRSLYKIISAISNVF